MGCDIHCHIEVKVAGKWEHWAAPRIDRSYRLFAKMAGVRGSEVEAIAPRRGLPSDISNLTRLTWDLEKEDAHSESWMTGDELEKLIEEFDDTGYERLGFGYVCGSGFSQEEEKYWPATLTDVRMVFWFDN
jgi:hypothetical protein